MTKEGIKHRTNTKKPNVEFGTFLKNQQDIVSKLKTELKSVNSKVQLSNNGTEEKDKYILELEHSINQREAETRRLNINLDQLKEENSKILLEFNFFKEKFCQLEIDYDQTLNFQNREIENLRAELQKQQTAENQEIQKLSLKCQDLQQRLEDNIINSLQKIEEMKLSSEQQQKEFELYKKQVSEEKIIQEQRSKLELNNLKDELRQKEEIIKQCISDKSVLEKEKDLIINELNNKIQRIEKAFSQPTKAVQPMRALDQQANISDSNSNSECSNDNVAVSMPQVRKPLETLPVQMVSNNENQKVEPNPMPRNYKFKRPAQLCANSEQKNASANRKMRNQPLRQPSATKNYNQLSSSSSDEDVDNDSSYRNFSKNLWRPSTNDCYIADTDASEGFSKPKRSKK